MSYSINGLPSDLLTSARIGTRRLKVSATQEAMDGEWAYYAGTAGSITVAGRVLAVSATAGSEGGYFTVNGGDQIIIEAFSSYTLEPRGALTSPVIGFVGTDGYVIEVVR